MVFYNGQVFDAHVFAAKLILSAKKSILLIDSWVDVVTLELLVKKAKGATVEVVTSWRVMTKDMQRVGTVLGARARRAALDGDLKTARELAVKTLALEPEQVGALEALGICARENPADAEIRELLKAQAARPSGLDFAKRVWKWVQDSDANR